METKMETRNEVFRVVDPEQLENLTLNGWRLHDHYEVDEEVSFIGSEEFDTHGRPTSKTVKRQIGKVRKFILALAEDSALKLKSDEVERLRVRNQLMFEERSSAIKEAESLRKQVAEVQGELRIFKTRSHDLDDRIKSLSDVQRKMEETIGRLRERLGTERFTELSK